MNKIEAIKNEHDGLAVGERIAHFAKAGWESISEADVQRLKWYGLFLRNPTPGHFMLRVRLPGGQGNGAQLRALAEIASTYGNGLVDVTTRQQVQVRHLTIEHVPVVFAKLAEAGLTSLQTGMDSVRNVMTCPVAGLNPNELLDGTDIVRAINREVLSNPAYTNLPRKCNIAVTGCPDNCLHTETQDIALVPAYHDLGHDKCYGYNVLVGGKLGSGGYRIASPLDMFVNPAEAFEVCRALLHIYRDHGPRENRTQARLAFLVEAWGDARLRHEVEIRVGRNLPTAGIDARGAAERDHIGIFRQKQRGLNYIGLKILVGRVKANDLLGIAALAERYGTGEVRLSPGQAFVIPHVSDRLVGELAEEPLVKQFAYNPSPLYKGLVSCVGSDYCDLAVIETKSRAVETARALERRLGEGLKPITVHWSGCPAGCGNHLVADVGLLGKKAKVGGKVVDAVDVFVGGRSGPDPKAAIKIMEDVPCDRLPFVLEMLMPYHTREKMHRVRGKAAPKASKASAPGSETAAAPASLTPQPSSL
ncbi:ferredoxin--nitrite reductase [Nitrospirales bacterium NOB]|nr:Sulfite reductase [ferredoxin] [Nitrospirota bacterium]MCE7965494.1 ferredoxin--nitrite reductase [Nitrospira sp. NTP2]MCK6493478.1 ferredoxin--nitrite reductase [Nitrospira sp.]MDL1889591.1 ferredoxin--nitrite reductase [Nitrospirales bacterium NOB]MEB2338741.1 ferredoxin--nitrite reductase [Nitrospirales bacterium]